MDRWCAWCVWRRRVGVGLFVDDRDAVLGLGDLVLHRADLATLRLCLLKSLFLCPKLGKSAVELVCLCRLLLVLRELFAVILARRHRIKRACEKLSVGVLARFTGLVLRIIARRRIFVRCLDNGRSLWYSEVELRRTWSTGNGFFEANCATVTRFFLLQKHLIPIIFRDHFRKAVDQVPYPLPSYRSTFSRQIAIS